MATGDNAQDRLHRPSPSPSARRTCRATTTSGSSGSPSSATAASRSRSTCTASRRSSRSSPARRRSCSSRATTTRSRPTRPSTRTSTRCAARRRRTASARGSSSTSSPGTSAGGINGVCLAKALALDAPQDGLRDLWLTKGAILKLLSLVPKLPPLAGNRMLKWLGGAFSEMDGHGQGSLMPPGLALNLFVTTTDINGYNRQIPIANPPAINTVVNKHVFEFSPPRRRRQPRQHAQPGARLRRARDVVLPRRVPRDGARRHPASAVARELPGRVLPRLRARRLAGRHDVLRRRRRARQLPVQACGARDRGQARLHAGRPAAPLHRARPGRPPARRRTGRRRDSARRSGRGSRSCRAASRSATRSTS